MKMECLFFLGGVGVKNLDLERQIFCCYTFGMVGREISSTHYLYVSGETFLRGSGALVAGKTVQYWLSWNCMMVHARSYILGGGCKHFLFSPRTLGK